ncbi:MAG: cob(I)yrinic acid a,c-diamide adenosyltransferase [Clostridium sp.]
MNRGLIHIYYGEGKGKTTSAIGLTIRGLGAGYRVLFCQFLKGQDTSEMNILKNLNNLDILRAPSPKKFTFQMDDNELNILRGDNNATLEKIIAASKDYNMVVLDEAIGAYDKGLLDREKLLDFLDSNSQCEIVLTGRGASSELLSRGDYISEIHKINHPYDRGIPSRVGIER